MDYSKIPALLLLAISMLVCLLSGTIGNLYSKKYISSVRDRFFYSIISQSFAAIALFLLSGLKIKCSVYTVIMAICFGAITMLQSLASLSALSLGPWSYTSVISSSSTVFTAFSGFLFWNEKLPTTKIIGISLMLVSLLFATAKGKNEKKTSLKWFAFALSTAVLTACVGLLQKVHQNSAYRQELSQFLIIAFISSVLFNTIAYFVSKRFVKNEVATVCLKQKIMSKKILFLGMVAVGIFVALNNEFNLYLVGTMDSAVFFPMVNGGGLILNVLTSALLFKEKLSVKQTIGVLLGIMATLLLCR